MQQFEHLVLHSENKDDIGGLGRKPTELNMTLHAIMAYGINLLEAAPFECLFAETQLPPSKDFIMGSVMPTSPEFEDGG